MSTASSTVADAFITLFKVWYPVAVLFPPVTVRIIEVMPAPDHAGVTMHVTLRRWGRIWRRCVDVRDTRGDPKTPYRTKLVSEALESAVDQLWLGQLGPGEVAES